MAAYKAIIWDFGGVITASPFEAFNRYEAAQNLPKNFIRGINATNPDTNAWARFERSDIDATEFDTAFRAEALAVVMELIMPRREPPKAPSGALAH